MVTKEVTLNLSRWGGIKVYQADQTGRGASGGGTPASAGARVGQWQAEFLLKHPSTRSGGNGRKV